MLNDLSSPAAFLATRRSAKPRDMVAPGPDAATLDLILEAAARTPDHGKLFPWRFVVVEDRAAFAALLQGAYRETKPEPTRAEIDSVEQFARQGESLVVVLSQPAHASHIPIWEQELSAGAACMNLVAAATAHGFAAGWLTGWAAYATPVRAAFSADERARVAGFIFIGTPGRGFEERPRPDMAAVTSRWPG